MDIIKIPQGYDFVPLAPSVNRRVREEARLDRRMPGTLSGRMVLTLLTEQPLHIGEGSKELQAGGIVRRCARILGKPGIPGSSLKGLLRARYEAITLSCVGVTSLKGGISEKIRSTSGVGFATIPRGVVDREATLLSCRDANQKAREAILCPACALFGYSSNEKNSLRGRISVLDLHLEEGALAFHHIPEQFGPNLHHLGPTKRTSGAKGEQFEVQSLDGRKFSLSNSSKRVNAPKPDPRKAGKESGIRVEVIPANSRLRGELRFQNLLPEELGGLLCALGYRPSSALKLGAAKAHGLGRVRASVESCDLFDELRKPVPWNPDALRGRFEQWRDRFAAGESALIQIHPRDC